MYSLTMPVMRSYISNYMNEVLNQQVYITTAISDYSCKDILSV